MEAAVTRLAIFQSHRRKYLGPPPHRKYSPLILKSSQTQNQIQGYEEESTTSSSLKRQRRPQNVNGEFFVDHTCIDCDTCGWMAPEIFRRADGMSAVLKQPSCKEE